jgi:hypothetical protein
VEEAAMHHRMVPSVIILGLLIPLWSRVTGRCGALASAAEITDSVGAFDPPAAAEDVSLLPGSAGVDASGKKDEDGSVAAAEDPAS